MPFKKEKSVHFEDYMPASKAFEHLKAQLSTDRRVRIRRRKHGFDVVIYKATEHAEK